MNHELIRKMIYQVMKLLLVCLVFLFIIAYFQIESSTKSPEEVAKILEAQRKQFEAMAQGRPVNENLPSAWPPEMNQEYPDFNLIDQDGRRFNFHALRGKIIVLEYVDFSSQISQSQSGSGAFGSYGNYNVKVDEYSLPFADSLKKNHVNSIKFPDDDVISLKIIVYGDADQATIEDAENWAKHFDLKAEARHIVAVAEKDIRDETTKTMIGGFQLLDKQLRLRVDSSGPAPKHNLNMTMIPLFEKLYHK